MVCIVGVRVVEEIKKEEDEEFSILRFAEKKRDAKSQNPQNTYMADTADVLANIKIPNTIYSKYYCTIYCIKTD